MTGLAHPRRGFGLGCAMLPALLPAVLPAVACAPAPPAPGARPPNVLIYVIDGGGADLMSLYGYERPTTPELVGLADSAVVFDAARSSAAWTKPSTAGFMTSLHHSALGGYAADTDHVPDDVVTMAEHFHAAGYQTGVFTTNPFAVTMSGLEAGVDRVRDAHATLNATSSSELQADFWAWRDSQPDGPWWAHIQTTDVHEPFAPVPPEAGLYASPARRAQYEAWLAGMAALDIQRDTVLGRYRARLEHLGVHPPDFFRAQWDLYDESMTHNDAALSAFIGELQARGEWEDTLFVLTADHGHPAGSFSRFARGTIEPPPLEWEGALADAWRTWVPLIVSWPGHLQGGARIDRPVSLLDLLPTVLDLAALPPAAVQQGRSLAPLLAGAVDWTDEPVVIEQLQAWPETGEMTGHIELIDGRWAASLELMSGEARAAMARDGALTTTGGWRAARPHYATTPRLLLYDLQTDPHCLASVNDAHPELVARYTAQLEAIAADHASVAARFSHATSGEMDAAQREALRVLGYVE